MTRAFARVGGVRLGELGRASLRPLWTLFLAKESGARQDHDHEAVHQMRVATRRLRAGLQLFEDKLRPDVLALTDELRWAGRVLGAVRDTDVQLLTLASAASKVRCDRLLVDAVTSILAEQRASARAELLSALDSERFARLKLSFGAWFAAEAHPGDETAGRGLPPRIRRAYRRLRRAGDGLQPSTAAADLHAARLRARQLRYALEFATPLYGKRARTLARHAAAFQDVLGIIQDATVAHAMLQSLPADLVGSTGGLREWHSRRAAVARKKVPRAYARLVGRPWRRLKRRMRRLKKHGSPA